MLQHNRMCSTRTEHSHHLWRVPSSEGIKVYTQIIPEYVVYLHKPDVTALQLTAQPGLEPLASVLKYISTVLLLLLISSGREDPQLFSIKVVPSPSVIVRWSYSQVEWGSMSNAVNCSEMTSPSSTFIVSVLSTLFGYWPG